MKVKTGIMVGVGEEREEVRDVMREAVHHGVDGVTLGQYPRPGVAHHTVVRSSGHAREQREALR